VSTTSVRLSYRQQEHRKDKLSYSSNKR